MYKSEEDKISYYLGMQAREESASRRGVRRHVDLVDDHCHGSTKACSFVRSISFVISAFNWHATPRSVPASMVSHSFEQSTRLCVSICTNQQPRIITIFFLSHNRIT